MKPFSHTGGPYPEGEGWADYHCPICGTADSTGCTCEADAEHEALRDRLAEQFGAAFVAWLDEQNYDIDDDDFVPEAARLVQIDPRLDYDEAVDALNGVMISVEGR